MIDLRFLGFLLTLDDKQYTRQGGHTMELQKRKKNHSRVGISGNLLAKKLNLCKFVYFLIRTRLNKENFIAIEKNLENHSNHIVISEKRADNEKAFPVTR